MALWGTWWAILPYVIYAVLYASTSDSRWHEAGHGTAFKTDWMNNALYEIASFMVMRESMVWRWSHTRHHSDTIIVGRDPEIAVPRPPDWRAWSCRFFTIQVYPKYFKTVVMHCFGRMSAAEKTFIPEIEFPTVYRRARIYVAIYLDVIALSIYERSILPLLLVGLTNLFGTWLMAIYGYTQHAGLAENVLDHRLNCRTVYMNPIHRYLYWNMNYHVEHHMFPLVPYHALPRLHAAVKDDCPTPYTSLFTAWREIVPAVLKQVKDPAYHVKRQLPEPKARAREASFRSEAQPDAEGWVAVCAAADLGRADVVRFDHAKKTYALYRDEDGQLYATDGLCTHGNTHLSDGLVKGSIIECPKHNGRFNLVDGSPARAPICRGLATYPVEERDGRIFINVMHAGGAGARAQNTFKFRVVSNRNVATFIKELVLEPEEGAVPSALLRAIICSSTFPRTIRFASATSTFPSRSPRCGSTSMSSIWWRAIPSPAAATTTRSPATSRQSGSCASMCASQRRLQARIARPASAPVTCSASSRATRSLPLAPSAISISSPRSARWSTSAAARAWLRCARISRTCLNRNRPRARSASGMARARGRRSSTRTISGSSRRDTATLHSTSRSPRRCPRTTWTGHVGSFTKWSLEKYLREHRTPKRPNTISAGRP